MGMGNSHRLHDLFEVLALLTSAMTGVLFIAQLIFTPSWVDYISSLYAVEDKSIDWDAGLFPFFMQINDDIKSLMLFFMYSALISSMFQLMISKQKVFAMVALISIIVESLFIYGMVTIITAIIMWESILSLYAMYLLLPVSVSWTRNIY